MLYIWGDGAMFFYVLMFIHNDNSVLYTAVLSFPIFLFGREVNKNREQPKRKEIYNGTYKNK